MTVATGQELALRQLNAVASLSGGDLEVLRVQPPTEERRALIVEIALSCRDMPRRQEGLRLRDRERFLVWIPVDFPFAIPSVLVPHVRFAGSPHVQWRCQLCLYQSPSTEWSAQDGMFGFVERLDYWLRRAAMGELDPVGGPLHPPVAYLGTGSTHVVVPHCDTPPVAGTPWLGFATLREAGDRRVDIVGWTEDPSEAPTAPAVLLPARFPFEYPRKAGALLAELASAGIPQRLILALLRLGAATNGEGRPLYLVIGTAMRGIRGDHLRQHLAVWRVEPGMVKGLLLSLRKFSDTPELRELGERAEALVLEWAQVAELSWCRVLENRPEVVVRRDHDSPMSHFRDKTVAVWGCGAIGSHVAEMLVRASVGRLILWDDGIVGPGLLTRQLFDHEDIGRPKAEALAARLRRINPALRVEERVGDVLAGPLEAADWKEGAAYLVEATADNAVVQKLELKRWTSTARPIPIISLAFDRRAQRGLALVARAEHSGGPADVGRRAKLAACADPALVGFRDAFWPTARPPSFQPEPGCSDSTFVGSAADVASLAAAMLNRAATLLQRSQRPTAAAVFVCQPAVDRVADREIAFAPDLAVVDERKGLILRIARGAWSEVQGWRRRARRVAGPRVETGGVLFGERNDAARVVWVDEVLGPPPDSEATEAGFLCGVEGVEAANREKRHRTRDSVSFLGMWHTHPGGLAIPSDKDFEGTAKLVGTVCGASRGAVILIVGGTERAPHFGGFLLDADDVARGHLDRQQHRVVIVRPPRRRPPDVGLALSGGGARAIAFHLGCLRALHDRGVLERVKVLSAVSGGAVIGALFAYGGGTFEEFDARVIELLRRGLLRTLTANALGSCLPGSAATLATAGVAAAGAEIARPLLAAAQRALGIRDPARPGWVQHVQPPLRRWFSRTSALEETLRSRIFGTGRLTDTRRHGLEVVINATELRTMAAFRFGSKESGCWRFGRLEENDVSLARAVAASAAYPVFLPALDCRYRFASSAGVREERVILTDGGVFDNLGVSCLEPGRFEGPSLNVHRSDYILCCDAGPGLPSDEVRPYWWPSRMRRAFESVFRKVHDAAAARLHALRAAGEIKGFVMAYLGQRDDRLPLCPPDLVRREEVAQYPTNFSAMKQEYIDRLANRGERLMRLLLDYYCPEL